MNKIIRNEHSNIEVMYLMNLARGSFGEKQEGSVHTAVLILRTNAAYRVNPSPHLL
jgi:hypothetical protein